MDSSLQLILNVVMITSVTTLAVLCRMLHKENQRLTSELNLRDEQDRNDAKAMKAQVQPVATAPPETANIPSKPHPEPQPAATAIVIVTPQHDIQQFAARRAQGWLATSATKGFDYRGRRKQPVIS